MPLAGAPILAGSGFHLPLPPPPNHGPQSLSVPATISGPGPWTGTWANGPAPWLGSFEITGGPLPDHSAAGGVTHWEFSGLAQGNLPAGTFFRFMDLDAISGPGERIQVQAFGATGSPLTTPWLTAPVFASGPNSGAFSDPNATPGWTFVPELGQYLFHGNTVPTDPMLTLCLLSTEPIYRLEVTKFSVGNGFLLAAPPPAAVPEPGPAVMTALGIAAFATAARRIRAAR